MFAGVDHILHGGDVGGHAILRQLEEIAPVTAVIGNTDYLLDLPELESVEIGGRTFFLQHIVNPDSLDARLNGRVLRTRPAAVIYGHTHKQSQIQRDGTLFLNPGYAGRIRFRQPRSVAILTFSDPGFEVSFIPLPENED